MEPKPSCETLKIEPKPSWKTKRGWWLIFSSHFERKYGQHGPKLDLQLELKWIKNVNLKIHEKVMPPGIGCWNDFCGFWEGKWSQVGTKMESKIDLNFETRFLFGILENQWKLNVFVCFREWKLGV